MHESLPLLTPISALAGHPRLATSPLVAAKACSSRVARVGQSSGAAARAVLSVRASCSSALRCFSGTGGGSSNFGMEVACARLVRSVTPNTTLRQALRLFEHHHVRSLPVLDEQRRLVGVVSLTDLLGHSRRARRLKFPGRGNIPVSRVMSQPAISTDSDTHVVELIPLLSSMGLHCLPVLEKGELVGIVTQTDLITALHRDLIAHLG